MLARIRHSSLFMETSRLQLPGPRPGHLIAASHAIKLEASEGVNVPAVHPEHFVVDEGDEEGEIMEPIGTREEQMEQSRSRKRGGRKKKRAKAMEHCGVEMAEPSVRTMDDSNESALCLRPKIVLDERSSHEKVAMELARCLQEVGW